MILKRLTYSLALLLALLWSAPLEARTKKGDKYLEEGKKAEAAKDYLKALDFYEKAVLEDPMDAAYQLGARRVRFQAGQAHVDRGQTMRKQGKLDEAMIEFQKAYATDPSSVVAEQEMKRTRQMLDDAKKEGGEPKKEDEVGLTPAQVSRKRAEERAGTIIAVPELKPMSRQLSALKMANQSPKILFETIGKLAGINVLFDSEFQDQGKRYSLDLNNTTLDEALDYASMVTKTFWKPLSANAIFVTNDNATKRRDYEEHVTRVFYLQNLTSNQELQEAMTAMRTVTDVRKVFPFNSQSAIVVRGTADQVAMAEKILLDLDKAKPEVVVDVFVMEANRTKTRDWALTPVYGGKPGIGSAINFVPRPTITTGGGAGSGGSVTIPIGNLNRLNGNDWSVTLPGAMFQALMSDRSTRVLQSPQVRATNGQKASLRLGDRYPYATGSFQPGIGGVGVSPLVSTQFQFADVGVNADVTPQIHGNDEVSMQIELEVSSIRERIDVGGLQQPVIGQRKVNHIIRVREGEVTLIGGLMGRIDSKTRGGIPGLTSLPVIGKIFSSDSEEKNDSELLVALIPHIVRYPDVNASNVKTIATGTEAIVKLNFAPRPEDMKPEAPKPPSPGAPPAGVPALAPAQRPPVPMAPPLQAPAPQPPVEPPAAPSDATAVPPPPPSPAAQPQAAEPAKPAADTGAEPRVLLVPSSKEVPLNQTFDLQVKVENVKDLFAVPMRMSYDPRFLQLMEVVEGSFMNGDGQKTVFTETKTDQPAGAVISLNRVPGAGGISGSGTLVTLRFKTQMRGTASVSFSDLTLRDGKLQTLPAGLPFLAVTIK